MGTEIDAHQHFWSLGDPWFDWPGPEMTRIHRDFGPSDLSPHLAAGGVDETVLVQVAPSVAETEHLLDIADGAAFVAGVVGWIDIESSEAVATLRRLADRRKFVGIRPMIQSLLDPEWMLRPALAPALTVLSGLGLTFDALIRPHHLPILCAFVDRYPDLRVVLDHGAKPEIGLGGERSLAWAKDISALAMRPQVRCKLSGLLTEGGSTPRLDDVAPFIDHLLAAFGPERLMWGSDWPVVETVASYESWLAMTRQHLAHLSNEERDQVFGRTAREFYRLPRYDSGDLR